MRVNEYVNVCVYIQKKPPRGILRKRCSENIQQIYRRTPMLKCDFNKVAKSAPQREAMNRLYHF